MIANRARIYDILLVLVECQSYHGAVKELFLVEALTSYLFLYHLKAAVVKPAATYHVTTGA